MPLKGNLDTFRLEEILQLIASQRKTGVLRLGPADRRAMLVFEEGRIVSTHEPGSREPSSLEASLLRMKAYLHSGILNMVWKTYGDPAEAPDGG